MDTVYIIAAGIITIWFGAIGLIILGLGLSEIRHRRLEYSWRGW